MRTLRLLLVAIALLAPTAIRAELEHEVKAAFLFQFLSYVEWPENTFPDASAPFVIGVLGADDVREDLVEIARGRLAQGRPIEVRRLNGGDSLSGLHVLFVGGSGAFDLPDLTGRKGVLLVGDADGALDRGAMVNLVRVGDHVRFQVAPDTAERGGLRISSRMLAVAVLVKPARP